MSATSTKPTLLSKPHRDVLEMVGRYHYVTARQVTRLLYSANSKTFANQILKDLTDSGYLANANWIPKGRSPGQPEYVWSLRPKGYRALADLEIDVAKRMSYTLERSQFFMAHTQAINDTLIAAELFARKNDRVVISGFLHEEALKREGLNPTPDGWVKYTIGDNVGAILWEIDRGTEDRTRWTEKIGAYITLLDGHAMAYERRFGDDPVVVAVVVRSLLSQRYRDPAERCGELVEWTESAIARDDAPLFLFTACDPAQVSPREFFTDPVWFQPFSMTPSCLIPRERLT